MSEHELAASAPEGISGPNVTQGPATSRPRSLSRLAALVAALVVLTAAALATISVLSPSRTYEVVVPAGTAASGRSVAELFADLPQEEGDGIRLVFQKGDTLVARNDDSVPHVIGVFSVAPGETVTHRFNVKGEFIGNCTLLGGEPLTVIVK